MASAPLQYDIEQLEEDYQERELKVPKTEHKHKLCPELLLSSVGISCLQPDFHAISSFVH